MAIVDEGMRICENEKCRREFHWVYFVAERSRMSGTTYIVNEVPNNKGALVHNYTLNNTVASVEVNCPHCSYDNHFIVEVKK